MAFQYYTATSLDGFIATRDDGLDWLDAHGEPAVDSYTPFIAEVGAIAMGSATYEFIHRYVEQGNDWPYQQPVWVFTSRRLPEVAGADIRFVQGSVADHAAKMQEAAGQQNVWVAGGGDLAGQFLDAGLLDELILTIAPHTLGQGKPLLPRDQKWQRISVRELGSAFVEMRFRPAPEGPADEDG